MDGSTVIFDRVTEYARKVVSGNVVAGELHILACKRHLNDLKRQRTEEFPYYYDPEKAMEIIEYAETLTIAEGTEPKPVVLLDSQAFDLGCTFGWFKVSNGKRRFRRRYKSVARQKFRDDCAENIWVLKHYISGVISANDLCEFGIDSFYRNVPGDVLRIKFGVMCGFAINSPPKSRSKSQRSHDS